MNDQNNIGQDIPQMPSSLVPPSSQLPQVQQNQQVPQAGSSQDEMKSNLAGMFSKIEEKYQDLNSKNFVAKNGEEQAKSDAIKEVFTILQNAGIDPSDLNSVNEFLVKLKSKNIDMYNQVSEALNYLIGEDKAEQPEENLV